MNNYYKYDSHIQVKIVQKETMLLNLDYKRSITQAVIQKLALEVDQEVEQLDQDLQGIHWAL